MCGGPFESLNRRRVETVPQRLLTCVGGVRARRHGGKLLLLGFRPFGLFVFLIPSIPSRPRDGRCGIIFVREIRFPLSRLVGVLAYLYDVMYVINGTLTDQDMTVNEQATHVAHLVANTLHDDVVRRIDDVAKVPAYRLGTHVNTYFKTAISTKGTLTTCRHVVTFSAKPMSYGVTRMAGYE